MPYYGATGQVGWIDRPLFSEELVLVGEDGAPFLDPFKPKAYIIDGPSWVNNHAHVLRALPQATSSRYLKYLLDWVDYRSFVTGTTRLKLTKSALNQIPVPLPPVGEQRRIVAAIEENLSRLDAADADLAAALDRTKAHQRAVLFSALAQAGVPGVPVSEMVTLSIGGVWGSEPGSDEVDVDVFRVTEFRENGVIDASTAARRSITHKQLASRRLQARDLLIEKSGGGPDRPVGRVALVPDHLGPSVCSNFVQMLRPDGYQVAPEFLFHWLQRRYLDGSAERHQTASTNIRNLKTSDYLSLPAPLPSLDEQQRIAEVIGERTSAASILREAIGRAQRRSASLRRAVLKCAFHGELVPQDPSDEPASALLQRIQAQRAAGPNQTRRRRVSA